MAFDINWTEVLVAGGGASAISLALFRFLGTVWIESKFAKALEAFRHEQAKEMANFTAKVDGALSATIQFQEKEFQVLGESWQLANKAYGAVQSFTSVSRRTENLTMMSSALRSEYVEKLDIFDAQKKEILQSEDPQRVFERIIFFQELNAAEVALNNFGNYLFLHEIFISEELAVEFKNLTKVLKEACQKRRLSEQAGTAKLHVEAHDLYQGLRSLTHFRPISGSD